MSTASVGNTKEEVKNMDSCFDAEVNKNPALDSSKVNVTDKVDCDTEVFKVDSTPKSDSNLSLEPQISLKMELSMDKDESCLRIRKEEILASVNVATVEESKETEVKMLNLIVQSPGRPDNIIPTPFHPSTAKATLFTLKEACKQQIKFEFIVSKKEVSGLKYIGEVWKKGIKVDTTKKAIGKFSPREEPYKFELEEATTPSGFFARGSFAARARFVDEDGKCHFDASYYFDIQKNWAC